MCKTNNYWVNIRCCVFCLTSISCTGSILRARRCSASPNCCAADHTGTAHSLTSTKKTQHNKTKQNEKKNEKENSNQKKAMLRIGKFHRERTKGLISHVCLDICCLHVWKQQASTFLQPRDSTSLCLSTLSPSCPFHLRTETSLQSSAVRAHTSAWYRLGQECWSEARYGRERRSKKHAYAQEDREEIEILTGFARGGVMCIQAVQLRDITEEHRWPRVRRLTYSHSGLWIEMLSLRAAANCTVQLLLFSSA